MLIVWLMWLSVSAWAVSGSDPQRPNIVFILADDLGWDDVSFHGSTQIPTPNLDTLAYDGIILSQYYVQPICTPSRSALMTGKHPIHLGTQHEVIHGSEPWGVPLTEKLLPQYLKELNYSTHMVGKWHLGFYNQESTPLYRGFDSDLGYYEGCGDYWDHTYTIGQKDKWGLDFHDGLELAKDFYGQYSTEVFTSRLEKIIHDHDTSQPLFLYVPQQAVHSGNPITPLEAPWKYLKNFDHISQENRRKFAGMVSAMDDSVGNITKALAAKGILNDTIIVFSTDNGGPAAGFDMNMACNYPLRGIKHTLWEGGVRGAGFVWSPLLQESAYVSSHMMQIFDWLPTLLSAAGYDMESLSASLDGMDMWHTLSTNPKLSPRTEMLHNIDPLSNEFAVRVNDMKLVFGPKMESWSGWYKPGEVHHEEQLIGQIRERETEDKHGSQQVDKPNIHQMHQFSNAFEMHLRTDTSDVSNTESTYNIHGQDVNFIYEYNMEPAPSHMFESDLAALMKSLGRPVRVPNPYVVQCGDKPANATTNCEIAKAPCLYNITADPCEYNNLASKFPNMVTELMSHVTDYNQTAVPPLNKPEDPNGYPIHHKGAWVPWM